MREFGSREDQQMNFGKFTKAATVKFFWATEWQEINSFPSYAILHFTAGFIVACTYYTGYKLYKSFTAHIIRNLIHKQN